MPGISDYMVYRIAAAFSSCEGNSAKRTIVYSAIGLTIALGAFVLSNIITQLATAAFGK